MMGSAPSGIEGEGVYMLYGFIYTCIFILVGLYLPLKHSFSGCEERFLGRVGFSYAKFPGVSGETRHEVQHM